MCATLWSTNWIDKGHLLEWAVTQTADDFPSRIFGLFNNFGQFFGLLSFEVKIHILFEAAYRDGFSVELHPYFRADNSCQIVNAFGHQGNNICVELLHAELFEVRPESNASEIGVLCVLTDRGFVLFWHVFSEHLRIHLVLLFVSRFDQELLRENVG